MEGIVDDVQFLIGSKSHCFYLFCGVRKYGQSPCSTLLFNFHINVMGWVACDCKINIVSTQTCQGAPFFLHNPPQNNCHNPISFLENLFHYIFFFFISIHNKFWGWNKQLNLATSWTVRKPPSLWQFQHKRLVASGNVGWSTTPSINFLIQLLPFPHLILFSSLYYTPGYPASPFEVHGMK